MAGTPDETPYQSLYRRFRPSKFSEVRGQDHVVLALRNAVRDGRVAHAYLFSGPRGTGKTSTARILAKALNCTDLRDGEPCGSCASCVEITKGASLDVHELDAASNNGVEAMRDLVARAALGTPGRQKVYIIDEVHMLSAAASNALLKTLEEPPAHVVFVLATTDPQKVLPTIRSRTQHFEFHLLGAETLGELLDQVRRDADLSLADEALDLAVRRGRGSARDALSVLDQMAASEVVDDDLPELGEIVEALAERDVGQALRAVARLVSAGFGPQQLAGDLVEYLRLGFLTLVAPDLAEVPGRERDLVRSQAERVGLASVVRAMEVLGRAQVTMREAPDPRVDLEVALVRLAHPEADDSPDALLARIERLEATERTREVAPPSHADIATGPPGETDNAGSVSGSARPPSKTLGAARRRSAPAAAVMMSPAAASAPSPPPPDAVATDGSVPGDPEPVDPQSPPAVPMPTRDELVQAWGDHIIGRLRPKAKALFQAGRFVGSGERAVFGLPNEIHRARCEEVRGEVESALSEHFGRPIGLELVIDDHAPALDPDDGRPRDPARPSPAAGHDAEADQSESISAFEESELGEVAEIDNSVEVRVMKAFPGAEEVG